jgi:hypothetical protein
MRVAAFLCRLAGFVALLGGAGLGGAEIPSARLPAGGWAGNVGVPGGIPTDYRMFCNVRKSIPGTALVASGDGLLNDAPAIAYAVQHCPDHEYVYLPAGKYLLYGPITRKGAMGTHQHPFSIELRGDGPALTRLLYHGPTGPIIGFYPGAAEGVVMAIDGGDARGSTRLRLDSSSRFLVPGIYAVVHRKNAEATSGHDPGYMKDTASQIVRIVAVGDGRKSVALEPALNEAYPSDYLTVAVSPPFRCGIRDLYLENDLPQNRAHNIQIISGQECWIQNVESNQAAKWHVRLQACARCEVRECFVHDGWDGGGDSMYGVGLFQYCCNNLVEDNIAYHCRHSYVTEYGGQGNVFAYNLSLDPVNENQLRTDYLMGDLIHHGGDPRWNLWEGNVASDIKFDAVLGGSSDDTAFRNLIRRKGLPTTIYACFGSDVQRGNYDANLVGNVYERPLRERDSLRRWGTNQDDGSAIDPQSQATAILDGEYDEATATLVWAGPDHRLPDSYYLTAKPDWFGDLAWPPIDPRRPESASISSLPAGRRWLAGQPTAVPVP